MTPLSASDAKSFFTGLSLFHNAPERAMEIDLLDLGGLEEVLHGIR